MLDLAPAAGGFLMGLAGSVHCAAMCGAIFGACAQGARGKRDGLAGTLALHAGRLASYSTLGAVSGAAGAAIDWGANAMALPRIAAIVAGAVMVGLALDQIGAMAWLRRRLTGPRAGRTAGAGTAEGSSSGSAALAGSVSGGVFQRIFGASLRSPGKTGLFAVGASLGILPCGLLYGAVALAASTADPARGAITMALFALGGAAPLIGLSQAFRWVWSRGGGSWINRLAAGLVLLLGIGAISGRAGLIALARHEHDPHPGAHPSGVSRMCGQTPGTVPDTGSARSPGGNPDPRGPVAREPVAQDPLAGGPVTTDRMSRDPVREGRLTRDRMSRDPVAGVRQMRDHDPGQHGSGYSDHAHHGPSQ